MARTLVSRSFGSQLLLSILSCSFILSSSFSHPGGGVSALPLDQVHDSINNTNVNVNDSGSIIPVPIPNPIPISNPNPVPVPVPVLDSHDSLGGGIVDGKIIGDNDKAKAARHTCEMIAKRFSSTGSAGRVTYPGVCMFLPNHNNNE